MPHAPIPDRAPDPSIEALLAARPHLSLGPDGLCVEKVPLARIARSLGTPLFVYSETTLRERIRSLTRALAEAGIAPDLRFALKANATRAVLATLVAEGAGADVVSEGEIRAALSVGIDPARIVFSGVGKTPRELRFALAKGVGQLNVESAEELAMLSAAASEMGRTATVALRVNPDVDAGTLAQISTGRAGDKFGIPIADIPGLMREGQSLPGIRIRGLAVHIGSQIGSLRPLSHAFGRLAELVQALRSDGHTIDRVDCGGGLAIGYRGEPDHDPSDYARIVAQAFGSLGVQLLFEPGRWLVGTAGLLLASVVLVKRPSPSQAGALPFVILDAAMNDLIRPSLYDAWHGMIPASFPAGADVWQTRAKVAVVGPVCESTDRFAADRSLPSLGSGDLLAILDAGAYGSVMSSTYNARPRAAEAMVRGESFAVVRDREPYEALEMRDRLPSWIPGTSSPRTK